MPYRILCNGVKREGIKASPDLASGLFCYVPLHKIRYGIEIDRSIKLYDKLVVVCSKYSLQSGPVQREIERALQREDREGKYVLFPIRLDNYIFDCWEHPRKADVLAKVVGDFRGWNRNAAKYDASFQRLLKALKAQNGAAC